MLEREATRRGVVDVDRATRRSDRFHADSEHFRQELVHVTSSGKRPRRFLDCLDEGIGLRHDASLLKLPSLRFVCMH